jgi:DHA2 family multidrug resistance protein
MTSQIVNAGMGAGATGVPGKTKPLASSQLILLAVAAGLATFMEILDITIANVSIPTISGSLGVSPNQGTWIISAYAIAAAIAIPLTGWLARRIGENRLFASSVLAFTVISALAALSTNLATLVALRLLQGFVSGPMVPLSQTILVRNFAPEKRGTALAFWAMMAVLAPVCGPLLGGYISDNFHWGWIFLINIPIGTFCVATIATLMRGRETPTVKSPLDIVGLAFMVTGIGALQLMIETGKDHDWFESSYIAALAVIAVVTLTFFVAWAWLSSQPIVDLRLFKDINFRYGVILLALGYMVFFGSVVVVPLWLQSVMGYTPFRAGLAIAPLGLFPVVLSPVIGMNVARLNLRLLVTIAFTVMGSVSLWNSFFSLDIDFSQIIYPRLLQGLGMSCFFIPLQNLALSNIQPDRMASATSLLNFFRTLAAAMGTAISVTMWERLVTRHRAWLVENISEYSNAKAAYSEFLLRTGMDPHQSDAVVELVVNAHSSMLATNQFFRYSAVAFFTLTLLVWFIKPVRKAT